MATEQLSIHHLLKAMANLIKLPKTTMWLDYDTKLMCYTSTLSKSQIQIIAKYVMMVLFLTIEIIFWWI